MMTQPLTVVDAVAAAADTVDHIFCAYCWMPGLPMLCGAEDDDAVICPEDCPHPTCPMCALVIDAHVCPAVARG